MAWRLFLRALNKWLREHKLRSVEWLRVFEWTPGSDELGHPHFHVWIFSPYLDREMLVGWWETALMSLGCISEHMPVVDIRSVSDPNSVSQELIKYLTKDIDANGDKLEPQIYGRVYCALDSHRSLQGSRGFMQRANKEPRACECGATLPRLVRRKKPPVEEAP